jgi:hypothetical protein
MNREEALERLLNLISSDNQEDNIPPKAKENEYIIKIELNGNSILFCCEDLTWEEALRIEALSFRKDDDEIYFNGEYEKRELIKKVLKWIYSIDENRIEHNDVYGSLLSKISQPYIESFWSEYYKRITLDAKEANSIYTSALKYFKGETQDGYPVLPLIIEVDYMTKGILTMTRDEFKKMSISDFERLQLIMTARSDAFGLAPQQMMENQNIPQQSNVSDEMLQQYMSSMPKI